jgi:class 3 adenylate cyclase/tetratricopeptide (TPR) repeat protein
VEYVVAMQCSACLGDNPPGARFCNQCAAPLAGTPLARPGTPRHLAARILASRTALEGERKQVTVLFADVKSSMELADRVDPEAWHGIMQRFVAILAEGVHRFEGTVIQFTGDGVMALFGAPLAHEDHVQRACWAALHLRTALRDYADTLRLSHGLNFAVRMGLNSGDVVVGRIGDDLHMDYTAVGQTVGLAARMEQLAEPGRIYLTQHTEALARGYFRVRDLGALAVKGLADPVHVFDLEDAGAFRTRLEIARAAGFTPFIGRDADIGTLETALAHALDGAGEIVGVVGEAGVGKSRLCFEFLERCRRRGIRVREAHCPAHGKSVPYVPILQLFRAYFGIDERDGPPEARRKIAGALLLLDEAFRESLPLVFDFLGAPDPDDPLPAMDPEARQRRLLDVVARALRGQREPTVLFVDDLHWIDPESDAFLAGVVDAVPGTRTLLLVNHRPEYAAPWTARPDCRRVSLAPLDADAVGVLVGALLGPDAGALKADVAARSGGNPFFAEELVRSLAETGHLAGEKGRYRVATTPDRIVLPTTVQSVLAARIDRAGEREKAVLEAAAVIGIEFSARVLERVVDVPADALAALCAAEFVVQTAVYPEPEYAFRHPLTQEVAYRTQLATHRARLHAAVARTIADVAPERGGETAALVAHHWEAAGDALEAARSHRRAAEWIGVRDVGAAVRHWRRVRDLLADANPTEETLRLRLIACSAILGLAWRLFLPREEADRLFAEGADVAERLGDRPALLRLRDLHAMQQSLFGDVDRDRLLARSEETLAVAREIDDVGLQVTLLHRLAWVHILRADVRSGLAVASEGIRLANGDPDRGRDSAGHSPLVYLHGFLGFFLLFDGQVAEGTAELQRAIAEARRIGDDDSLQFPLGQMSAQAFFSGDAQLALPRVLEAVDITNRIGNRWGLVMAYSCLGHTYLVAGEWERALAAFDEERRLRGELENPYGRTWILHGIAEARLGLGRDAEALALADEGARIAREHRWPYPEAVGLLTLVRALRRTDTGAAAPRITAILTRLDAIVAETGMVVFRAFAAVERGELAGACGDAAGRRTSLAEAHRLFAGMGATGHAQRVASVLGR